jgi:protein-tyrosine-phosphatase
MLDDLAARKLATRVVKESDAIVRFGKTNGRNCLHIRAQRMSETIYSVFDWEEHRWNRANKPRKARVDPDILSAVANKEAA